MLSFLKGMAVGISLIVAIGPQNAHVLRMGLTRQHVFLTALVCTICDSLLIALGISGLGLLITANQILLLAIKYSGAAFLFYYGARSLIAAFRNDGLQVAGRSNSYSTRQAAAAVLAMSLLNPHVYLDTVMLIGSVGAQEPGAGKLYFGLGAALASLIWFFALAYGARLLIPVFAKPAAWKILDICIALIVWSIGLTLLV